MPTYQLPQATAAPPPPAPRMALMSVGVTPQVASPDPGGPIVLLPVQRPLEIYKGDDERIDLVVTNPDGTDTDLANATPSAQIRTAPNGDLLASFVCTVEDNIIHLHLPHEQSVNLTGTCAWDAQISIPTGARQTVTSTWNWSTDHTGANNPGDIGINTADWDADDLFVNVADANYDDQSGTLSAVLPGDQIRVELVSDRTRFADYTVSATPVLVTGFWEFPLALNTSGGDPPSAGEPTKLTVPTLAIEFDITTLIAGSVTVSGEVTMP